MHMQTQSVQALSMGAPQNAIHDFVARGMSSFDLLDLVNEARMQHGESEVRRADFTARCKDELDGEYYETFVVRNSRGPASEGLMLTKDQCLLVSMRESKAVRRSILEKLKNLDAPRIIATLPNFSNPVAAARAWADEMEQKQIAQQALAIAAPKVEFVDKYVEATGLKGFRQTAKLLRANEARFREFLLDKKIMYRMGGEWQAYQQHIDSGRFDIKTGTTDGGHAFNQTKFTPKGVTWVAGLWAQYNLEAQ
ncbi:phage antirepressor KilAC domain-containing protein [Pseudomonas putida]|uniref:phage antirepressor KilAC domain-containing protein n=1 Tax=Pseudomonas putida TaxID=303 RepID=UPI002365230C|nr:phage antirepressor KilAC domain-containing protein [Pseudomonas putida]MDD2046131.1 phage antirepressor KilAC domain-containing protein [Pseudomonas putida]